MEGGGAGREREEGGGWRAANGNLASHSSFYLPPFPAWSSELQEIADQAVDCSLI